MSDAPQGPGWWQASDDKWYPPPRPDMPGDDPMQQQPPVGPPSDPGMPPSGSYEGPPMGGHPGMQPSPYGGMPMQPGQPPGQGNRTMLFAVLGGLGALVVVGLMVLLLTGGDDSDDSEQTVATSDDVEPEPEPNGDDGGVTTEPAPSGDDGDDGGDSGGGGGGGGAGDCDSGADATWDGSSSWFTACGGPVELNSGLVVEDYGYSSTPESISGNSLETSYAAIIENTSDQTIEQVEITFSMYKDDGDILASEKETIYVLDPGERMAVGGSLENAIPVASLTVSSGAPSSASSIYTPGDGTFTVNSVTALVDRSTTEVTFEVESTFSHTVERWDYNAFAVLKNDTGGVIGGGRSTLGLSDIVGDTKTTQSMDFYSVLEGADLSQTEVFVGCSYTYCSP